MYNICVCTYVYLTTGKALLTAGIQEFQGVTLMRALRKRKIGGPLDPTIWHCSFTNTVAHFNTAHLCFTARPSPEHFALQFYPRGRSL